ncbi:aconitase X [Pseudobacillus wudalianchiensis]|uniref:aconitase X n=1 Tax=Pseudobacillus wudalianchiensis TaxID=1743143 RepID=UPI000ACCE0DD|nr:aconitase X catalytic domain-containing protein [Bacillus wudalianchiensis]
MSSINLSKRDQRMLNGEEGKAKQIAMKIIIRMAEIQGAIELVNITHAHIGGSIYTGIPSLEAIEKLVEYGAKVSVPTTINAISVDRKRYIQQGIDQEFASNATRLAAAFEKMGVKPIFSCTPYIFPDGPSLGEHIMWAESNAIAYANSVLGARTNRHGDFMDICAAITGRVPLAGLHEEENRIGTFLVEVPNVGKVDTSFYTVLGYLIGKHAGEDIPVIEGIKERPTLEQLKYFSSTIATSGAVGMYHMVGITPEAKTLKQALGGKEPKRTLRISQKELLSVWENLSTSDGSSLDLVVMGSPHFTLDECRELAKLVEGEIINSQVDFLITTSSYVYSQAEIEGLVEKIERFGARFSTDICLCMLNEAMFPKTTKVVMTNSGKFAHYGPGLINKGVYFGSMKDCVTSAISGKPVIDKPNWLELVTYPE